MKKRFDIGIRAGTVLAMETIDQAAKKDVFVGVSAGKIVEVSAWKPKFRAESKKFIDAKNKICLPGLVNGHVHLAMVLMRGLEDDVDFHTWLFEKILPLEQRFVNKEFVRVGTELAALECIRFGVTTVNEMYFYSGESARVLEVAGMRAIVSQAFSQYDLPEDKDLGRDKGSIFRNLRKKFAKSSRITIGLGPHAPYSCPDEMLQEVKSLADEYQAPVHIHVSETAKEVEDSRKQYLLTPVERLQKLGLLRSGTLCAHCVHFDEADISLFQKSGASALYNPDSNMKLGSGVAPISAYLKANIPVSFGTDGAASNNDLSIFGAMDIGTKLQKLQRGDARAMTARQALWHGTHGGAKALGLDKVIGSIALGKSADLILIDQDYPHLQPMDDPFSHLVYSANGLEVDTVLCEGRVLLEGKKHKTLNAVKIFAAANRWRQKMNRFLQ